MSIFAQGPAWFTAAAHEIGTREEPENRGAAIRRYIAMAHVGAEGEPWCAIFVNAMLESCGVQSTRSASSQSFAHDQNFVKLPGPALGCIVVFYRGGHNSGHGHVGFYRGETVNSVYTLGGNEGDMVQIEPLPKASSSFGVVGYYWPKSVILPDIARVTMPAGLPHVTTPQVT